MTTIWYCTDCETRIDSETVEDHESRGHHVKGTIRPDRLLGNDPWNMQVEVDGTLDTKPRVSPDEGGED
ncbi:MAG: hypothetical protein U5K70_06715 [Halodesulfurarchaeum sp.]|nr:hypothetical protein [Halodesulfurarchaeum sp.]